MRKFLFILVIAAAILLSVFINQVPKDIADGIVWVLVAALIAALVDWGLV
jgi:short subunit fatty acids transporter